MVRLAVYVKERVKQDAAPLAYVRAPNAGLVRHVEDAAVEHAFDAVVRVAAAPPVYPTVPETQTAARNVKEAGRVAPYQRLFDAALNPLQV